MGAFGSIMRVLDRSNESYVDACVGNSAELLMHG